MFSNIRMFDSSSYNRLKQSQRNRRPGRSETSGPYQARSSSARVAGGSTRPRESPSQASPARGASIPQASTRASSSRATSGEFSAGQPRRITTPLTTSIESPSPSKRRRLQDTAIRTCDRDYNGTAGDRGSRDISPHTCEFCGEDARHRCRAHAIYLCARCFINAAVYFPGHTFDSPTDEIGGGAEAEDAGSCRRHSPSPVRVPTYAIQCCHCEKEITDLRYECLDCFPAVNFCAVCCRVHNREHALEPISTMQADSDTRDDEDRNVRSTEGTDGASDDEDSEISHRGEGVWDRASVLPDGDEAKEKPVMSLHPEPLLEDHTARSTAHTRELRPRRRHLSEHPSERSAGPLSTTDLFGSSADVTVHRATPSKVVVTFSTESFVHFARTMMGAADTIMKDRNRDAPRGYIQDTEHDHQEDDGDKLSEDEAGSEPFDFLDDLGSDFPEPASDHRLRRPWALQDRRQLRRMKESGWTDERAGAALRRSAGAVSQQWRKQKASASD